MPRAPGSRSWPAVEDLCDLVCDGPIDAALLQRWVVFALVLRMQLEISFFILVIVCLALKRYSIQYCSNKIKICVI